MASPNRSLRSWMQEHHSQLMATGNRWRQAVSTGWTQWGQPRWESAGRSLRVLARASGGFLTASWGSKHKPSYGRADLSTSYNPAAGVPLRGDPRPVSVSLRSIAEACSPQSAPTQPIAFTRPGSLSSRLSHAMQSMPVFDAEAREQARKNAQTALSSTTENKASAERKSAADQKLAFQLEEVLTNKCEEFSIRLERRLDSFYEQTALRLDVLSEEVVRHFCEVLNRLLTEALGSVMSDRAAQNRALVNAECHAALDRFAGCIEDISSSRLESHRKEIQEISSSLKIRLRSVAYALEELGPVCHRT